MNAILWPLVVVFAVCAAYRLLDRVVAIYEARASAPDPLKQVEIPADLVLRATLEGEEWAREDAINAMRESYDKLGSWDAVRIQFGLKGTE